MATKQEIPMAILIGFLGFIAVSFFSVTAYAETAAKTPASSAQSSTGFGSGLSNVISDFQAKLPAMFRELSPEDVGHKPRIKTHFAATSSFTTDADLSKDKAQPAWLARAATGLTLEMPIGDRLYTEVDYTFAYATAQGPHISENTFTHNLSALARYTLTDATQLGLKHNIQWSQVPGAFKDYFTLSTTTAEVNHRFSDILSGYVQDTFQWFQDRSANTSTRVNQEYIDNGVGSGLSYDVTDRITLKPSAVWNNRNFTQQNGKDYWQVAYQLGAAYKLGSQTSLEAHFGHNFREFSRGFHRADNGLIYGVGIANNVTHKLSWHLNYDHSVVDTFDTNFLKNDGAEATNLDNLDRNFRVMSSHRFGSGVKYNLNEKNMFALFGDVQLLNGRAQDNVIRGKSNDEITMELGPSYSFRINKYLSLDFRYVFGRRFESEDSGAGRPSYTFQKIGGGLSATI